MMKKIIFLYMFLLPFLVAAQSSITKNISDFTVLKVYNGIAVELIKSSEQKVEITGEKADKVKIKSVNDVLKISLKLPEVLAKDKVKVKLFYNSNIAVIDANEASTITGKQISQPQLEVKVQEGAFINLVVNTTFIKIKASSGGVLKLSGSSKNQEVNVDLGGVFHGYNLKVKNSSTVKAGTGGKAEIYASEILDVKVTFGGSIYYKGKPEVLKEKKVVGGVIEQKG